MLTVLSRAILRGWSTLERRSSHSSGTCNQLSPVCICPLSNDTLYTFFSLLNGTSLKVLSVGLHSKSHQQILSVRIDIQHINRIGSQEKRTWHFRRPLSSKSLLKGPFKRGLSLQPSLNSTWMWCEPVRWGRGTKEKVFIHNLFSPVSKTFPSIVNILS